MTITMNDNASIFSDTSTLYDVPILQGDRNSGFLPIEECYTVLFVHHDHYKADSGQLTRAGLPALYDRVDHPTGTQTKLAKLKLKRERLQVQFPMESIQHATIERTEAVSTLEQVRKMMQLKQSSTGRIKTMMDSLDDELVGVQTRKIMNVALAMLFRCPDVRSPTLYYPAQNVLLTPSWAVDKGNMARAAAQYATISFVSPAKGESMESKEEAEKRYFAGMTKKETEEEVLERLFVPSQECEVMMQGLLRHLESRGAIWGKAGLATQPSIKNSNPKERPEFVVLGLFPQQFVNRCKVYHGKGTPMPSDLEESGKSKYAPLITTLGSSSAHQNGKGSSSTSPPEDFLAGWSIRFATEEPYRTGSIRQDAGAAVMMGGGLAAGTRI